MFRWFFGKHDREDQAKKGKMSPSDLLLFGP